MTNGNEVKHSWIDFADRVYKRLERFQDRLDKSAIDQTHYAEQRTIDIIVQKLREDIGDMKTEIALLNFKTNKGAVFFGLIGGAIPVAIGIIIYYLTRAP